MMYLTNNHDVLDMLDVRYMHNVSMTPVSQAVVNRMSWIPMIYKDDEEWPDIANQMRSIFERPIQELDRSTKLELQVGDRLYIPVKRWSETANSMIIRFVEVQIDV